MQNENKRVLSNFFQLLKLVVLLVSYFPTLLLWSISWSSIFSSPLSSPLNFIPLLFVDLLCSDILQRVREREWIPHRIMQTLADPPSNLSVFSFFCANTPHSPAAVTACSLTRHTNHLSVVLMFQNVWEILLLSSQFSVSNTHSTQKNT